MIEQMIDQTKLLAALPKGRELDCLSLWVLTGISHKKHTGDTECPQAELKPRSRFKSSKNVTSDKCLLQTIQSPESYHESSP